MTPPNNLPGAHAFIEGVLLWDGKGTLMERRARHHRSKGGKARTKPAQGEVELGIQVDHALTCNIRGDATEEHSRLAKEIAFSIQHILEEKHDVLITTSQVQLRSSVGIVSPVADLLGYRGNRPGRGVLVEVKTGESNWRQCHASHSIHSDLPPKHNFFRPPFENIRDTWRNRSFAQLALQLWTIKNSADPADFYVSPQDALLVVAKTPYAIRVTPLGQEFYDAFEAGMGKYVKNKNAIV